MHTNTLTLRLVQIGTRPSVGSVEGALPHASRWTPDPGWLLEIAQGCAERRGHRARLLQAGGRALAIQIGPAGMEVDPQPLLPVPAREPELADGRAQALLDAGGQLRAWTPGLNVEVLRQHLPILALDGRPTLLGSWSIHAHALAQSGPDPLYVLHITPVETVLVPAFAALTPTQLAVCELAALGLSTREIAREQGCRPETARTHLRNAYLRTGAGSRAELATLAADWQGWVEELLPQIAGWVERASGWPADTEAEAGERRRLHAW